MLNVLSLSPPPLDKITPSEEVKMKDNWKEKGYISDKSITHLYELTYGTHTWTNYNN